VVHRSSLVSWSAPLPVPVTTSVCLCTQTFWLSIRNAKLINDCVKGRSPTTSTSESPVNVAKSSMPWEGEASTGKYSYHPGGDPAAAPKDAPSAINVVVVPDVNLPKVRGIPIFEPRSGGLRRCHRTCAVLLYGAIG
jgi:hypothetical protein